MAATLSVKNWEVRVCEECVFGLLHCYNILTCRFEGGEANFFRHFL